MSLDSDPPEMPIAPVTDAVVADAVGAHAAEGSGHHHPVHTHCENCGTGLRGPFCHHCGQHDIEFHRSFGHVFLEALESFFHFDEKLFRNIVTLLFRPGVLTGEFNAGKRAAQMPPLRLYIFISVLFFFVRFLGSDQGGQHAVELDKPKAGAVSDTQKKPEWQQGTKGDTSDFVRELDQRARHDSSGFVRDLNDRGKHVMEDPLHFADSLLHALPRMLLFCLPFFALYTRVLFRKSGQVYLQHLIVALHYHTFVYLWWLVAHGWNELVGLRSPGLAGLLGFLTGVWMFIYPFRMLRHLFGQSWTKTIIKTLLLAGAYALTLGLGLFATAAIIFFSV